MASCSNQSVPSDCFLFCPYFSGWATKVNRQAMDKHQTSKRSGRKESSAPLAFVGMRVNPNTQTKLE
jgi:hypothetical protein